MKVFNKGTDWLVTCKIAPKCNGQMKSRSSRILPSTRSVMQLVHAGSMLANSKTPQYWSDS
jgi:hypothetical protein